MSEWKSLSRVWLSVTLWTIQPWNPPGHNTGVGSLSLLQGIFPTQVSHIAGGLFTSWAMKLYRHIITKVHALFGFPFFFLSNAPFLPSAPSRIPHYVESLYILVHRLCKPAGMCLGLRRVVKWLGPSSLISFCPAISKSACILSSEPHLPDGEERS